MKLRFGWLAALVVAVSCLGSPARAQQIYPTANPVGGGTPFHYLSTASTNANLVGSSGQHNLYMISVINTTTTVYYLKLYDVASAPTCNSSAVVQTFAIPFGASNAGGGAVISIPLGIQFANGLGFCITGGSADSDNSNAATGITLSLVYSGR